MSRHLDDIMDWEDWAFGLLKAHGKADGLPEEAGAERDKAMRDRLASLVAGPGAHTGPVPMALHCPKCGTEHVDEGEWATTRHHRTHRCAKCEHEWRPFDFETVGVVKDTGESQAYVSYYDGAHDGPGWYYTDSEYPEEGSVGSFDSFEEAARHAAQSYYRICPPELMRPASKEAKSAPL